MIDFPPSFHLAKRSIFALITMLLYLFLLSLGALVCGGLNQVGDESLLVNAIVAKNNISTVECWKIEPGYQLSNVVRIFEL
jgi:hypothetical protein